MNDVYSDDQLINYSVPQRTVLGPLLCIIYINGLLNQILESKVVCIFDDMVFLGSDSCPNKIKHEVNEGNN